VDIERHPMRGRFDRLVRAGACLALATATSIASAQTPPGGAAPAPSPTGASPNDPAPASDPKLEEARSHFNLGIKLLRDPEGEQVEAAYIEFKTAYDLSRSPRVLGNIGYCAMKLERASEALSAYGEYLRLVPTIDPRERAQIDEDLKTLTSGSAKIVVTFSGGADWTLLDARSPVRGQPITNTYGPFKDKVELLVHPGRHVIKARIGTTDQGTWEIDAAGGATLTHDFAPLPPPKPEGVVEHRAAAPSSSHVAPWVVIGAGAAALAVGTVTGLIALNKTKSLEQMCPNDTCPAGSSYRSDVSSARAIGTATDVLLIGGGLVMATGVTWLILTSGSSAASASSGTSAGGTSVGRTSVGAVWLPGAGASATVRVSY
jgi:hypothetical protein